MYKDLVLDIGPLDAMFSSVALLGAGRVCRDASHLADGALFGVGGDKVLFVDDDGMLLLLLLLLRRSEMMSLVVLRSDFANVGLVKGRAFGVQDLIVATTQGRTTVVEMLMLMFMRVV